MIDFQHFSQKYTEHLAWLHKSPIPQDIQANIYTLFSSVSKNGGWVKTIGLNNWDKLSDQTDPRKLYENYFLVSFERKLQGKWDLSPEETLSLDFSHLKSVKILTKVPNHEWEEIFNEDLIMIRDVYKMGINKELLSLNSLKKNHGNEEITVLIQEADTSGFSVKQATKQIMQLKDYIKIMEKSDNNDQYIRFGVNIDFGNWNEEVDELRKCLPSKILWCSKEDSLDYLRQHILGMSLPQLYMKIQGCWTGGHEENLRFPAANINHGPSSCEWWGLDRSQSLQLRECIKNDKGFEIYKTENLWWPDEIYCIAKGLNVFHTYQEPGDLIFVGPGTIHWVKSCGVTTNSAWNFGPKYLNNFRNSFERYYINKAISYKNLVPLHILSLDLLNMELGSLDVNLIEFLKEQIIFKSSEEENEYISSGFKTIELNNSDNVINCEICYQELFRFYYKCIKCTNERYKGKYHDCFFCLSCAKNVHKIRCKGRILAVQKMDKEKITELMDKINLRLNGNECEAQISELKYPYDKNTELGVYKSQFNGVDDDAFNDLDKVEIEKNMKQKNVKRGRGRGKKKCDDETKECIAKGVKVLTEELIKTEEGFKKNEEKIIDPQDDKKNNDKDEVSSDGNKDENFDKEIMSVEDKKKHKRHVVDKNTKLLNSPRMKKNQIVNKRKVNLKNLIKEITQEETKENKLKHMSYESIKKNNPTNKNDKNEESEIMIKRENADVVKSIIGDKLGGIEKNFKGEDVIEKINCEEKQKKKAQEEKKVDIEELKIASKAIEEGIKRKLENDKKTLFEDSKKDAKAKIIKNESLSNSKKVTLDRDQGKNIGFFNEPISPNVEDKSLPLKRIRSAAQYSPVIDIIPSKQSKNLIPSKY
ncbi:hypothetical protein SteCoe_21185 [Stentor coeruleus]|uniref:JmjC domain-containing protein n=1 Tax=Stentor coeruleus TaxID=5963 RepID=A0A1R2BQP8_9CILI|nr:hypothetical protein SteCoe_21185 [Stentor coeruleus]